MTDTSPDRSDWAKILLLWAAGLGAAAQYGKVSVAFASLDDVYPTAGASLGLLVSAVGLVGVVLGATAGALVSRIGPRAALLGALVLGAVVSAYQATLPPLPLFLASRVLEGVSHLAIVVAAPTMIAQLATTRGQGLALTLWGTFFGIAFAITVALGLPLIFHYGPGALFLAHGIYVALSAAVLWAVLPEDPVRTNQAAAAPGLLALHLRLYTSPRIAAPALGWLFYTFTYVSFLTLIPPFLLPETRAFVLAAIPLIGIVVSLTAGVALLRYFPAVGVIQTGFVLAAAALVLLFLWEGDAVACLLFAAALGLIQGASFAAVPQLNASSEDRALSNGALAQSGNIGNALGTPVIAYAIAGGGYPAMIGLAFAAMLCGFVGHMALAWARR